MTIEVSPRSIKAKNRFANLMASDSVCVVEQVNGNKIFLRSANNRYHFWVDVSSNEDWFID
tara:strand:+ start:582 stop:764 length:183 start_codon:yes stop_codon:yes gene_type:complete